MLDLSYKDLRKLSKGDKFIMEFDKKTIADCLNISVDDIDKIIS